MRLVPNETHLGIVLYNGLTYQPIGPLQIEVRGFLLEPLHDCEIDMFAVRLSDTNAEECPVIVPFSQCPNFFIISWMFLLAKQDLA